MRGLAVGAVERMSVALEGMPAPGRLLSVAKLENDDFLYLVLVEQYKEASHHAHQYVTWWWNDQSKGFSSGHYFRAFHLAFEDYQTRLNSGFIYSIRGSKVVAEANKVGG